VSTTIKALLERARARLAGGCADPRLDAEVLMAHVLGRDRSWLYAHADESLPAAEAERFATLLERRGGGVPVSQITGRRAFWKLDLAVSPATLIPRPETEHLVEAALHTALPADARVLDLGTGSGAVALALAIERPGWRICAVDRSQAALLVARANAHEHGLDHVDMLVSDWFGALREAPLFDLVVSNPPYIPDQDPHLARGDLRFEPRAALAAGVDGLDAIARIVDAAPRHLRPGGWLWLEHGYDQQEAVSDLLQARGFSTVTRQRDLAGLPRDTGARWPG
jgi:release factor glutamine methyltransferase